jgi:hypothetical protein
VLKGYEPAADETTAQLEIIIGAQFNPYGRIVIRHTEPLPLTILGVLPNVELGG